MEVKPNNRPRYISSKEKTVRTGFYAASCIWFMGLCQLISKIIFINIPSSDARSCEKC